MCVRTVTSALFIILLLAAPKMFGEGASFAVISDTHVGAGSSEYAALMYLLKRENVRHIVHTGDAIYHPGNVREWRRFINGFDPQQLIHLAAGNHDIADEASLEEYLKFFPRPYYSFSNEDVLFVLLNTELPGEQNAIMGRQLACLASELQRPFKYKFVFMHKPFFSIKHQSSATYRNPRETSLHSLFVKSGVSLVVAGHYHRYERASRDGITYIVMAPGHYVDLMQLFSGATEPSYMIGTRMNNGVSFSLKNLHGRVIDEFVVSR